MNTVFKKSKHALVDATMLSHLSCDLSEALTVYAYNMAIKAILEQQVDNGLRL